MDRTVTESIGLFKLTTGEEIIAEYNDDSNETFTLTAPRSVIPQRGKDGGIVINIGPWFFSAPDESFIMSKSHVLAFTDTVEKGLRDAYFTNTSGLQIAQNLAGLKI
jgi:hypothetical protein